MISASVGNVMVQTTTNRASNPEEIAERCTNKIISISESASPEARAQAVAFRDRMKVVIAHYIKDAIIAEKTKTCSLLEKAGHKDLMNIIQGL
jgi:hypothetical protein